MSTKNNDLFAEFFNSKFQDILERCVVDAEISSKPRTLRTLGRSRCPFEWTIIWDLFQGFFSNGLFTTFQEAMPSAQTLPSSSSSSSASLSSSSTSSSSSSSSVVTSTLTRTSTLTPALSPPPQPPPTRAIALPPPGSSAPPCAGCGGGISERFFLSAAGCAWHARCLRCAACRAGLARESTCFHRDGRIYCRHDYFRRYSSRRCARCSLGISSRELVMRARELVFHVPCFACSACARRLAPGDQCVVRGVRPFCHAHAPGVGPGSSAEQEVVESGGPGNGSRGGSGRGRRGVLGSIPAPGVVMVGVGAEGVGRGGVWMARTVGDGPALGGGGAVTVGGLETGPIGGTVGGAMEIGVCGQGFSFYGAGRGVGSVTVGPGPGGGVPKGRPRKRKQASSGTAPEGGGIPGSGTCGGSGDLISYTGGLVCNENGAPTQKAKRLRTSFKHHQLRAMKSYFALNHNPDAKDLRQLAQRTGLTKRVLQVWFQNARAKFRRNLLRQEAGGGNAAMDGAVLDRSSPTVSLLCGQVAGAGQGTGHADLPPLSPSSASLGTVPPSPHPSIPQAHDVDQTDQWETIETNEEQ
uniref:LIM/homeobox protein Lhx9 n=2 Tax=Eptatretus burgeri TaxID=7764 RepID=A0A8C4NBV7_EPTBU